jgi:hypothetical protein
MTTEYPILCKACRRWMGFACLSFPSGIPESILVYGGDHRKSIGLEAPFELDPEKQAAFDEWMRFSPYAKGGNQ